VFPSVLAQYAALFEPDTLVALTGRVSCREDESPQVLVDRAVPLEQYTGPGRILCVTVPGDNDKELLRRVLAVTGRHRGETPLAIRFSNTGRTKRLPQEYSVVPAPELQEELGVLVGRSNVKYV